MKKVLALALVMLLAMSLFACTPKDDGAVVSPSPVATTPDVVSPDATTPDVETPDVETPDANTPDVPAAEMPAEVAAAGAMDLGVWPLGAGTYDPGLDAEGIPDGAHLYGYFTAAYTNIDLPETITGYDKVEAMADLVSGTFIAFTVNTFNYVAVMS